MRWKEGLRERQGLATPYDVRSLLGNATGGGDYTAKRIMQRDSSTSCGTSWIIMRAEEFANMDPTVDQVRKQLVEARDEIDRLRALFRRLLNEAPNGLQAEASYELLAQVEAAAGPQWRVIPGISMPKGVSTELLAKRLHKLEQAHARLGDIATRIRAQGSTIADLVHLAETYIDESATLSKDSAVKGGGRRAARARTSATAADATAAPPAASGVTHQAPRRTSTQSRKPPTGRSTSST